MSMETELKLTLAPEQMAKLQRHPQLAAWACGRAVTQKLYSVYYDTPGLALHQARMALRLRRAGKRWMQTLKGGGGVEVGLHSRNEWETPVAGEALDLAALRAAGGELPPGVEEKLQAVFITDFTRVLRRLRFEEAEIELCLDSGEVRAGERVHRISELELELKSGAPEQLFRLALALQEIVPLSIEQTSKAEHGYRLFAGYTPAPQRAQTAVLDAQQPLSAVLQQLIWLALQHLQANVSGAIARQDEEYLHQVRVALRRLRVLLALTEAHHPDEELHALHEQLETLGVEFGSLREWDVLISQTLLPFKGEAGWDSLLAACEAQRTKCHAAVEARLGAQEFQRLLLRFGAWMYGPYWRATFPNGMSLHDFAAAVLQRQARQMDKRGSKLAQADAARLHALRIACKKLRYSAEMFASLFPAKKTRRFLAVCTELQEVLGAMNDITVAQRLLPKSKAVRSLYDLILARLEEDHAEQRRRLRKLWKRYQECKPFWRKPA